MNLLTDIQTYLKAQELGVADGQDLFRDYMPSSPDEVYVLNEYGGLPSIGAEAYPRNVQVLTRATTYASARTASWKLFNALFDPLDPIKLFNTRKVVVRARSSPFQLEVDSEHRVIFAFSVLVITQSD